MDCCETTHHASNHGEHDHKHDHGGGAHAGHHHANFLGKFWLSFILTIPVLLYSDIVEKLFSWKAPAFPGSEYLPLVLGTVVFFYGGWVFLQSAWNELKARLPGMMTLIAIAIIAAYAWSVYAVFAQEAPLFWELVSLITIMLLGHWVEMRAVSGVQGALKELSKLLPDTAELVRGSETQVVPLSELKVGDIVLVRSGSNVPADGEAVEGDSEVDESMVTGESRPIVKSVGDQVIAGTINGDGALKVRVTKIGEETFLSGVMRLVSEAEASKSRLQILSDRAAFYLTVIAVGGAAITMAAWLSVGATTAFAVARVVAVLVIACPHALGLAVPLVASISTTKAAKNGLLIKRRLSLETARKVDVVLFDKTGTLTEGKPVVTYASSDETLELAAAVNAQSEHPIARAITAEAKRRKLEIPESRDYKRLSGVGVEASVGVDKVFVGHRGGDDVVVEKGGERIGTIRVSDSIRPEARTAVDTLKKLGVNVAMITGDSEEVAKDVAGELGIDEYYARVKPEDKVNKVKALQSRGLKVAMVGDGINDAPALAQAELGVVVGAGTNVAIESAGIILVKSDPRDIPKIIKLSELTYSKMMQNIFWAAGYNIVAMPLAAGVLAWRGVLLDPAIAAGLMSLSTVIVAINAWLLTLKKLGNE